MNERERFLSFLGIARKAGKLSMGAEERSCGVAAQHESERHRNERHPRLCVVHTERLLDEAG